MGSKLPYEKAKNWYNLNTEHVQILYFVAAWFNGLTFEIHDRPVSIASEWEPTLRQLCNTEWGAEYDRAHEQMTKGKLFKSESEGQDVYIAGRRCNWIPTTTCMDVIEDLFSQMGQLHPEWVLDEHTRPPTFRDGPELMEHRKGVLAARHLLNSLEYISYVDTYPQVDLPQRPDLRLFRHGDPMGRVEVLTDHNNTETWESKFQNWRVENAGPTIWLYENREHMVKFWNHFLNQGMIELDGGRFGGRAKNWSPRRVNDRLRRSRQGKPRYESHDAVWTVPGAVGGDAVDAFSLLKDNNIILNS